MLYHQSGAILLFALIFMLALSVLLSTSLQLDLVQVKIQSRAEQRSQGFYAADGALRHAEHWIESRLAGTASTTWPKRAGLLLRPQQPPLALEKLNWQPSQTWILGKDTRLIIEWLGDFSLFPTEPPLRVFRISVRDFYNKPIYQCLQTFYLTRTETSPPFTAAQRKMLGRKSWASVAAP